MNDELENAQNRISSLEKALIAAREAIRILRNGGNDRSTINVSLGSPTASGILTNRRTNLPLRTPSRQYPSFNERTPSSFSLNPSGSITTPKVNRVPIGNASLKVSAQVQFLNNRNRPASFTEFFLVENSLDEIAANAVLTYPQIKVFHRSVNYGQELYREDIVFRCCCKYTKCTCIIQSFSHQNKFRR